MKILKAHTIDERKIQNPEDFEPLTVIEETIGKAKYLLYKRYRGAKLLNGDLIEIHSVPIRRIREMDCHLIDGVKVPIAAGDEILAQRKWKELIADGLKHTHYYLAKGDKYVGHNFQGLTDFDYMAGIFTKEFLVKYKGPDFQFTMLPIDIKHHNKLIKEKLQEFVLKFI